MSRWEMEYISDQVAALRARPAGSDRDAKIGRLQERFKELAERLPDSWISEIGEDGVLRLRSIFDEVQE